jgi:hypothetical protein
MLGLAGADDGRAGELMDAVGFAYLDVGEPATASPSRNSSSVSAPAMHPVHCAMSARETSSMPGSAMTSETANRPPGFSTRNASANTFGLSPERFSTQFETMTSTEPLGSGTSSM